MTPVLFQLQMRPDESRPTLSWYRASAPRIRDRECVSDATWIPRILDATAGITHSPELESRRGKLRATCSRVNLFHLADGARTDLGLIRTSFGGARASFCKM